MRWVFLALAGMEILKLHLLFSFLSLAFGLALPWQEASLSFLAAACLSRALRGRGGRLIWRLLLHGFGLGLSSLALYALAMGRGPGPGPGLLILALGAAYWARGAWLGGREQDHDFCVMRFEEGIWVFLAVLSMAALVRAELASAKGLILPFFLFGFLSLGLSQAGAASGISGSAHFRSSRMAALLPAAGLFLLAGAGLVFLMPALGPAAGQARVFAGRASLRLLELLGALFTALYHFGPATSGGGAEGAAGLPPPSGAPGPSGPLAGVLVQIIAVLAIGAGLAALGYLILSLARVLASRVKGGGRIRDQARLASWIGAFLVGWKALLVRIRALGPGPRRSAASAAFSRLMACGRATGHAKKRSETAGEYARRLASAFPRSAGAALFVAEALEREVYGGKATDGATAARLTALGRRTRLLSFLREGLSRGR